MRVLPSLALVAMLMLSAGARAVIETYDFSDPALELRYRQLSLELRCPKCQNQNIADSNAPIAQDLRKQLYQQLEAGASNAEILDYMVARYGEFVRYRPRFGGATAALWLAPVILLLIGVTAAVLTLRGRRKPGSDSVHLSGDEERRVQELLEKTERDS
jgi:cytochrome c-type biogenesis protein CcmH